MWPCILCAVAALAASQTAHRVTNLDGQVVDPLHARPGVVAAVLVFLRTDCPVANQSAPEIERVRARFGDRGVRVWLVYLDPQESAERIGLHLREFGLRAPALRDPDHALVRATGVRVTPEAAVYVFEGGVARLIYRGRLDNRVAQIGRHRPRATHFDLREAIERAVKGTVGSLVSTPAVGCEIADLR